MINSRGRIRRIYGKKTAVKICFPLTDTNKRSNLTKSTFLLKHFDLKNSSKLL